MSKQTSKGLDPLRCVLHYSIVFIPSTLSLSCNGGQQWSKFVLQLVCNNERGGGCWILRIFWLAITPGGIYIHVLCHLISSKSSKYPWPPCGDTRRKDSRRDIPFVSIFQNNSLDERYDLLEASVARQVFLKIYVH